jgi:hypothetical protein
MNSPEAAVVAVATELLFLLEPEDDDLELAEFSNCDLVHWTCKSGLLAALEVHDELVDFVDGAA